MGQSEAVNLRRNDNKMTNRTNNDLQNITYTKDKKHEPH